MDKSQILPELVTVKCERIGEGPLTLHFNYKQFVGIGKLFLSGSMKGMHERTTHKGYKLMLLTSFSTN